MVNVRNLPTLARAPIDDALLEGAERNLNQFKNIIIGGKAPAGVRTVYGRMGLDETVACFPNPKHVTVFSKMSYSSCADLFLDWRQLLKMSRLSFIFRNGL